MGFAGLHRRVQISQYWWKLFCHETNFIISVSSIFLSEYSRITSLDVLFTVITWKTQQSISEFINRSRKTLPLLSGSFFFEMECVINQTLYTLKHQLDNLKFSLIFIKYSCFKRQSECKNVNVIKTSLASILLIATVLQLYSLLE